MLFTKIKMHVSWIVCGTQQAILIVRNECINSFYIVNTTHTINRFRFSDSDWCRSSLAGNWGNLPVIKSSRVR